MCPHALVCWNLGRAASNYSSGAVSTSEFANRTTFWLTLRSKSCRHPLLNFLFIKNTMKYSPVSVSSIIPSAAFLAKTTLTLTLRDCPLSHLASSFSFRSTSSSSSRYGSGARIAVRLGTSTTLKRTIVGSLNADIT